VLRSLTKPLMIDRIMLAAASGAGGGGGTAASVAGKGALARAASALSKTVRVSTSPQPTHSKVRNSNPRTSTTCGSTRITRICAPQTKHCMKLCNPPQRTAPGRHQPVVI
jgi:hypothetical protein